MDPDQAFAIFCAESGFEVAHGMSKQASGASKKLPRDDGKGLRGNTDIFAAPSTPFAPSGEAFWTRIEPGAIGSSLVLLGLISLLGFGGWTVLQQVQRVQVAPVEQTPTVLADLDPLDSVVSRADGGADAGTVPDIVTNSRNVEALDRLYRPQALDVPVLVARDAPIATLDPREIGNFAQTDVPIETENTLVSPSLQIATAPPPAPNPNIPRVVEEAAPALQMVAVRDSWVRVRAADGTVIFEAVMKPGDTWEAPLTEEPPTLRTGNAGGIYFAMRGAFYGPVGPNGAVTSGLPLSIAGLQESYNPVAIESDEGLTRYAEAQAAALEADAANE